MAIRLLSARTARAAGDQSYLDHVARSAHGPPPGLARHAPRLLDPEPGVHSRRHASSPARPPMACTCGTWPRARSSRAMRRRPGPRSLATLDPSGHTLIAGQQDGSITAYDLDGGRRLGRAFSWNVPDAGAAVTRPCMAINGQSDADGERPGRRNGCDREPADAPAGTHAAGPRWRYLRGDRVHARRPHAGHRRSQPAASPSGTWPRVASPRTLRFADPVWWTASQSRRQASRRPDLGRQQL